ncbi:MAG: hypothetical protein ACFFKA_10575 [Candidatus Thorarchaeota archaeon]|jgi:hypothetical protein
MTKSTNNKKLDIKKETIAPAVEAFNNAPTMQEGIEAAFNILELEEIEEDSNNNE